MKRVKREQSTRAFSKGYNHGVKGNSRNFCPYEPNSENHQNWISGWREGREDLWSGFSFGSTLKRVNL